MTDQGTNQEPVRTPGERRLARPPSERYRTAANDEASVASGSAARAVAYGSIAALVGAALLVGFGGILGVSAGLVPIAAGLGWAVAAGTRSGGGSAMRSADRSRAAVLLAMAGVAAGQLGLWLYARFEGGVLGPLDYLGETFGVLVPVQLAVAVIAAWLSTR